MSAPLSRERFAAELVAWINRKLAPPGTEVDAATPLFADRLINSIRILEIIAWVERAIGRRVTDREIRMDNFHTVERIAEVFVREPSHVDA
jgi:acyl carrier protein